MTAIRARVYLLLVLLIVARLATAQRIELSADTALTDEKVGITVSGLAPHALVTMRLVAPRPMGMLHSSATYRADAAGRIDLTRDPSIGGDYRGVHAMGLFWSLHRDSAAGPPDGTAGPLRRPVANVPPAVPAVLTAEVDGRVVAADTLWQRAMSGDVRLSVVRDSGLTAVFYQPAGSGRHPGIIVLGGSTGGLTPPNGPTGGLASRGYAVLSLAYFAAEGLPERLGNIPLEYMERAIQWMSAQPSVDPNRLAVYGTSRGGELALVVGSTFPQIKAVVANVPSHVAWPGMMVDSLRGPAWTLGGKAIPYMDAAMRPQEIARKAGCATLQDCPAYLGIHNFFAALDDERAQDRAAIPVERIRGPILLFSGKADSIWPSAPMTARVVARLKAKRFAYPVEHYEYENAGHSIGRAYAPTSGVSDRIRHPLSGMINVAGGTPEGTAIASEDAWRRALAFLDKYLRR